MKDIPFGGFPKRPDPPKIEPPDLSSLDFKKPWNERHPFLFAFIFVLLGAICGESIHRLLQSPPQPKDQVHTATTKRK
ncbi:MAG TPA: hypothetical protein VK787_00785 [Puia sp.]|jgi:hypothetical protein|nr:hypothetical protein [Puia sp.]